MPAGKVINGFTILSSVSQADQRLALALASEEERAVIGAAELTEAEWAFEQRAERRLTFASWALAVLPSAWAWRIEREVGRLYRRPT